MRLAIISDIHDNLVNLEKCLDWCRKERIETMICCGDLTNSDTLDFLAKNFKGKIHILMGNCDTYDEDLILGYSNMKYHDRKGSRLFIGKYKIGFCHEPYHIKHLFHIDKFDLIFYGHTHKPWESTENGVRLINPGTLGGLFQKATFATWESEENKLELKILEEIA
jgi:putative phosphoesterase